MGLTDIIHDDDHQGDNGNNNNNNNNNLIEVKYRYLPYKFVVYLGENAVVWKKSIDLNLANVVKQHSKRFSQQ